MAPVPLDGAEGMSLPDLNLMQEKDLLIAIVDRLKDVIQDLFELQSAVHGYLGPETQQVLVRKV